VPTAWNVRAALLTALAITCASLLTIALPAAQASASTACPPVPPLINGGLEVPSIPGANGDVPAANAGSPTPGIGWSTDDPSLVIELWKDGFLGVPADSGAQFVEINANAQDTLTQDVATTPGTKVRWHLAHRGRAGTDTMQLQVGAPGGPLVAQVPDGQAGTDMADGTTAWGHYTGVYTVPAGQTTTRFAFAAIAEAFNPSYGNFLDSVSLELLPTATADSATTTVGHSVPIHVLANDCGAGLTVHSVGAVAHGTATVTATGITYTPKAGFAGTDTFSYTITDASGDTATATVTVHVTPPAGPTAAPKSSTGPAGAVQVVRPTVRTGSVLSLLDSKGHATTRIVIPGQGVYAVSGHTLTFTPDPGFTGRADTVRYRVTDAFGQAASSTYVATVLAATVEGGLPDTGAHYGYPLAIGLGLMALGLLLVVSGRSSKPFGAARR
jgi:CshA-type fibril repeat protein